MAEDEPELSFHEPLEPLTWELIYEYFHQRYILGADTSPQEEEDMA
jgi:hypothetical protein